MPMQLNNQQEEEEDEDEEGANEEGGSNQFYFCDQPHADYAHVIFTSTTNESLWSLAAIQSVCRFDQVITLGFFAIFYDSIGIFNFSGALGCYLVFCGVLRDCFKAL